MLSFEERMKLLFDLKKEAIEIAYAECEEKEFDTFWHKKVAYTTLENGQLAEIVYVFILAMLSLQTNHFRVSVSLREDRDKKIDFRVNGYPIQAKTDWIGDFHAKDVEYCKSHKIHLINCSTKKDNGEQVIRKMAVPFALSNEKIDAMVKDFDPTIDVINYIWSEFSKRVN